MMVINEVTDVRPWGKFVRFTHGEPCTVKILTINPHEKLSLQFHEKREEFWYVLDGNPIVTVGEKITEAKPDDEFFINKKDLHRIEAKDQKVRILEISFGNFDENDIVRIDDKYHRK